MAYKCTFCCRVYRERPEQCECGLIAFVETSEQPAEEQPQEEEQPKPRGRKQKQNAGV